MSNNFGGPPYNNYPNNQQQSPNPQQYPQIPTQQHLPPSVAQQPYGVPPQYPPPSLPPQYNMRQMQQPMYPHGPVYYQPGPPGTPIPQQHIQPQQNPHYAYPQQNSSISTEQQQQPMPFHPQAQNPIPNQPQMYAHQHQPPRPQPNYPQHLPPQNLYQGQPQYQPQSYVTGHPEDTSYASGNASAYSSQSQYHPPQYNHSPKPFNEYQARENARKVFRAFDTNKNGNLDLHEFMEALRRLALAISYHEALNIFQRCDRNFDGRIGEAEFIDLYVSAARARHPQ